MVYLEGFFDLFHVGYIDLLDKVIEMEVERYNSGEVSGTESSNDPSNPPAQIGPRDIFLILGILYKSTCLQSLHERGISMLSLR